MSAMNANITALEQDALLTNLAPRANAGGPYRVAEGGNIVFAGSASTSPSNIITYEWDLDGDGSFNDATGPNPGFTYTRAFQGLVGLKVTNADNLEDVGYAPLEVTNVNNPPRITAFQPADRSLDLIPGSSQSFSVTASDPEGDAVSVRWLVDGTPTAVYVGGTYPVGSPSFPGLIRKYDVDGNEISAHVLRFGEATSLTNVQDFAVGCAGVFAAGHMMSSTFVSRPIDTFVLKLSSPAIPCNPNAPTVSTTSPLVVVNEGQVGRNSGIYANAGTNQPVSLSTSVGTLTKTGSQDGTWEWSFNTTDGPAQSQVVTITADDGEGGISTALFELIVNNIAPTEKITGAPTSSPAGTPINLTSTVTDGGGADSQAGFTYAWTLTRDGQLVASGSESGFRFTPTVGGDYQVTLRVTDKDGGTSVNTVTIVVVQTNRLPLANAGPDRTVEATSPAGAAAVLDGSASSDPDGDVLTFTWTGVFGTATGQAPTVTLPLGMHTVTLIVDDGTGQTASDTVMVMVVDTTPPTAVMDLLPAVTSTLDFLISWSGRGVRQSGQGRRRATQQRDQRQQWL